MICVHLFCLSPPNIHPVIFLVSMTKMPWGDKRIWSIWVVPSGVGNITLLNTLHPSILPTSFPDLIATFLSPACPLHSAGLNTKRVPININIGTMRESNSIIWRHINLLRFARTHRGWQIIIQTHTPCTIIKLSLSISPGTLKFQAGFRRKSPGE